MIGKAQFIGGSTFLDMLKVYRILWLRGRYGGGKTSGAVIIAARMLAEGVVDQVVSNVPITFSQVATAPLVKSCIVMDESWLYIESRSDVKDYAAFVRKFKHYMLLPSVFPIHNRLSFFYVTRIANLYVFGLPVWWYRWTLSVKDIKETGTFGIYQPTAVFGHYPDEFVPGDDGGIADVLKATSVGKGYKGTRAEQKIFDYAQILETKAQDNSIDEEIEALDDIAFTFSEASEDIGKVLRAVGRKL